MIKLSQSCVGIEEKEAVAQVIEEKYLGMGKHVMLFEEDLEKFFSNKTRVVCVSTGTSALHLALQACCVGVGDEVLIPSITYLASFQATSATGAIPVACDIDLSTGCLDVGSLIKKITPKTKAIMYVHYAGAVGNRKAIFKAAKKYGLRVIEDAAHSFGGYDEGEKIGISGDITCFSFDGIKNITSAEGGAIVSNDEQIINKVRDLRLLGIEKDTENRYQGKRTWDFDVTEQGWRYHMSNMNAAIGREQLKKIDIFSDKRRSIAKQYIDNLKNLPVKFLSYTLPDVVPHIFPILVDARHRDLLKEFLSDNEIETGFHYKPNHLLTKYKNTDCTNSEKFGEIVLSLPMHVNLSEGNIEKITRLIKKYFKENV